MFERHLESVKSGGPTKPPPISIADLERYAADWLFEGEFRSHSPMTTATRRGFVKNLIWFLNQKGFTTCGKQELKLFFIYLSQPQPQGRWGVKRLTQPLRPVSIKDYFVNFKVMFRWFVTEGFIESSPMDGLPTPLARAPQIQPFSPEQITALLNATKKSCHAKRDYAIVALLLDCGLRAGELCALKVADIDLNARCVSTIGKGNKRRSVFFGKATAKALWNHLRSEVREPDDWVFLSDRGVRTGEPLKPNGLLQLFHRLGDKANIKAVRCSPHTLRHTYAVCFLRAGGSVFTLRESLGHTDLTMTSKYVMVADADLSQARNFSPMDRLKGNG